MNVLILCAGKGERLRPITESIPKALVKIDGIPILKRHLDILEKIPEIENIIIPVWYLGKQINSYVLENITSSKNIYIFVEEPLQGSAGACLKTLAYAGEKTPLMVINADTYYIDMTFYMKLVELYHQMQKPTSLLALGIKETKKGVKGLAIVSEDRITVFCENPTFSIEGDTYLQNAGVMILNPETFHLLKKLQKKDKYDLGKDFLPEIVKKSHFEPCYTGDYIDIGEIASYCELQTMTYLKKLTWLIEEKIDLSSIFEILLSAKGTIWFVANGGSLSVAQHGALDLTKAAKKKAIAISEPGIITAYSNDISFERGIATYLWHMWKREDVVIILSTSGESENLLSIAKEAKKERITTVALTSKGSSLAKIAKVAVGFEEEDPKILEDLFQIALHQLTRMIQDANP